MNRNELTRLSSLVFGNGRASILSAEEELDLIRLVQAGDDDAFWSLCAGYVRALRSVLKGFREEPTLRLTEARELVLTAFAEQVATYDTEQPEKRLSYSIKRCKRALTETRDSRALPVYVPERTMVRYRALRATAGREGWDMRQMVEHSSESGLSPDTARQLAGHITSEPLEVEQHDGTAPEYVRGSVDDADLVAIAFAAIADDLQATEVMQLKYGFDDPTITRRRTNGDIAEVLSCGPATVDRIHVKALSRMRQALGVETEQAQGVAA